MTANGINLSFCSIGEDPSEATARWLFYIQILTIQSPTAIAFCRCCDTHQCKVKILQNAMAVGIKAINIHFHKCQRAVASDGSSPMLQKLKLTPLGFHSCFSIAMLLPQYVSLPQLFCAIH